MLAGGRISMARSVALHDVAFFFFGCVVEFLDSDGVVCFISVWIDRIGTLPWSRVVIAIDNIKRVFTVSIVDDETLYVHLHLVLPAMGNRYNSDRGKFGCKGYRNSTATG